MVTTRPDRRRRSPAAVVSIEAEQALLGCLLIDQHAWDQVTDVLAGRDFSRPDHRLIFEAIAALAAQGKPRDVIVVAEQLQTTGELDSAGGLAYLGTLARDTATAANVRAYAEIVAERAEKRRLIDTLPAKLERAEADGASSKDLKALIRAEVDVAPEVPAAGSVHAIRVADVPARDLEPLWPGILWLGKLTLFTGDPGLSKSTMVCDVVARVTRRLEWPAEVAPTIDGDVLMLSAEDDIADTLRPRLEAAGADLQRVLFLDSIITGTGRAQHTWPSLVEHMEAIRTWLVSHPSVRLLVVDPLAAYLTGVDSHKQSDVRAVLGALSQLATQLRVAVLAVMHLNKGAGGNPLYRVSGSLAFIAAARAAYLVARDPQDGEQRLMLHMKNNLSRDERGFRYVVKTADNGAPYVEWNTDRVEQSAADVLSAAEDESPRERAVSAKDREAQDWLRKTLANGPVEAGTVWRRAERDGITERALKRAAQRLRVEKQPAGFRGAWHWALPPESDAPASLCTRPDVSESGQDCANSNGAGSTGRGLQ